MVETIWLVALVDTALAFSREPAETVPLPRFSSEFRNLKER
jgi:hypothetical protein